MWDQAAGLSLTLDYSKIELETFTQDATGKITPDATFGFDPDDRHVGGLGAERGSGGSVDPSPPATRYFMLIDGLDGGSTDKLHQGWFEISGFDLDLENIGSGTGGAGKADFSLLNVTLSHDAGLADVMELAATGKHVKGIRIEGMTGVMRWPRSTS